MVIKEKIHVFLFLGLVLILKSLIKFSKKKISPISINLVISNKKNAKGLKYANQNNIEKKIINFNHKNIAKKKILKILKKKKYRFYLFGWFFMKILSKYFIKKFNGKILNIHPSLLPKYKGLNTHKELLKIKINFLDVLYTRLIQKLIQEKLYFKKS